MKSEHDRLLKALHEQAHGPADRLRMAKDQDSHPVNQLKKSREKILANY